MVSCKAWRCICRFLAEQDRTWSANHAIWFASLLTIAVFVPIVIVGGLGHLRQRTLAVWIAGGLVLCAGIGAYDIFRDPISYSYSGGGTSSARAVAGPAVWISLAAMMFILHSLIVAGAADRRFIASYPRYFDVSWKHGVQLVLAVLFAAAFWLLLWLGAELFRLIKLELLAELIKNPLFASTATTTAFAYAIHVTDVRANLVTGARTLKLTLLSWLLPMMTGFAIVFLLALPFAGLEPLWSTRRATGILLTSVASLIFLINAAYQDGQPETPIAEVLRQSRWLAALAIVPLVALAGYGLMLRVMQHGWTPQRITALACVIVAGCYAAGYSLAAIRARLVLKQIEITNIVTAYVIVAVLVALFSPLVDPARISVADQISRLKTGQTPPEKFDYAFLRFGAGRYGADALQSLVKDAPTSQIAERAQKALQPNNRYDARNLANKTPVTPGLRAANITIIRAGGPSDDKAVPDSFLRQDWSTIRRLWILPRCLIADAKCDAVLIDIDGDGKDEILLFNNPNGAGAAFKSDHDESWHLLGTLTRVTCPGVRDALRAGRYEAVSAPPLKEIEAAGQRLAIANNECATAH